MVQTKIRGIRVEVQEVEHKECEVYEADVGVVVEVRNSNSVPGQQILVAFIEMKNNTGMSYDSSKEIHLEELKSIALPFANKYKLDRRALKDTANQSKESDIQDIARSEKPVE